MKKIYIFFVFALLIIILFPSFVFSERGIKVQSRRLALVIGNGAYKTSPLRNPVNDAYDMANSLRGLGFEVIHKENASRKTMKLAIREKQWGQTYTIDRIIKNLRGHTQHAAEFFISG